MSDTLAPCPFCGEDDDIYFEPLRGKDVCMNCGAEGPDRPEPADDEEHERRMAFNAWNNRADQKIRDAKAEAFEDAAREAGKERAVCLTTGTLESWDRDKKVRAQMRREIVDALKALAAAIRGGE